MDIGSIPPKGEGIIRRLPYFALSFGAVFFLFSLFEIWRISWGDTGQVSRETLIYFAAVVLLLAAFIIYYLFFRLARGNDFSAWWWFFVFLCLGLTLVWPLLSSDIFSYIYQGRVWSVHELNPYLQVYQSLKSDYFYISLDNSWSGRPAPYGPLFMLLSGLFSGVFSGSLWGSVFGLKFFFSACSILTAYLIYIFRRDLDAFYLYAFNPLVLFEVAINGHNDALFSLLLIAAALLVSRLGNRNIFLAALILTLSILVKYISLVLVPLWLIILWRRASSRRDRGFIFLAAAASVAVVVLAYWPFMSGSTGLLPPFFSQVSLSGSFVSPLIALLRHGLAYLTPDSSYYATISGRAIFLVFYLWLMIRAWRQPDQDKIILYSFLAVGAFLFSSFSWLMPWYFISVIALAALLYGQREYRPLALWSIYSVSFYGIIYYLVLR